MTVLFKADRLVGLNFLPHEVAADKVKGVFETDTGNQLGTEDCVALAAGMAGELVGLGSYDPMNSLDDKERVHQLTGQPIENFALEAYEAISQNLLFFVRLNLEVQQKMLAVLENASLSKQRYAKLDDKMPIFTLAEVEQVYNRAQSTLAGFPKKTGAS
jgi:hypothetical protein